MPSLAAPRPFPSEVPRVELSGRLCVWLGDAPVSPSQEFSTEKHQMFLSPCQGFRVKSGFVSPSALLSEGPGKASEGAGGHCNSLCGCLVACKEFKVLHINT